MDERHNSVRDWLAAFIHRALGNQAGVTIEQRVPKWALAGWQAGGGPPDVPYTHLGRRVFVDTAVVAVATTCGVRRHARAGRDGAAAASEEDSKRVRYPGPDLRPFVVEAHGRLGLDAAAFLHEIAPTDPSERSAFIGEALQELSVVVQRANAELLLRAVG